VFFAWCQQARTSGIPVDGTILLEITLKVAEKVRIYNFSATNG
jgi:hypothetical protein